MKDTTNDTSLLRTLSDQMADAVEKVSPALVQVNGRQRQPGSGLIIGPDLVLTANHVIERNDNLTIQLHDQRTLPAQFVGRDRGSDLALLRVSDLHTTPATPSTIEARVGQLTVALGRSNSEGPMASVGIISAIGGPLRTGTGTVLERYIRTDAIPYPGFSGGPLIDTAGHVIGILTTGLANGVPLAIPHAIAQRIADTLAQYGHIKRGYLGMASQLVQIPAAQRGNRSQEQGLLVVSVEDDTPARRAGLLVGDIVLTIDGQTINDFEDLHLTLNGERVGKAVPVEIIRGGTLQTLSVTIGQRP
jgi:S1-C subfamily serine protease